MSTGTTLELEISLVNNEQFSWKIANLEHFGQNKLLMLKIREEDKVSVLKHVVCSLMDMSDSFHVTMFNSLNAELNPIYNLLALLKAHYILHVNRIRANIEIIQKLGNSLQLIEKYLCRYISVHLVVQLRIVTTTTNEPPLAFRTNAYFVVPDTAFVATHRVTFHRFGSVRV